jgi:hypothetical protein
MEKDNEALAKLHAKIKSQTDKGYKISSKKRLKDISCKKIKTTMIGALDAIEKNFGFLWEDNSDVANDMRELYEKTREQILDNGNNQIRNLTEEFEHYNIEWLRYQFTLPIIRREEK